jgi:uncharacterized glyoxalase superfamily protein PhnB
MKPEFPPAVPEIPVSDLAAAMREYRDRLGFTVDWSDEELGLAGISKGRCRIFLANAAYRRGYGNVGPSLTWLNLDSRDAVNELHRFWAEAGARIVSPPESKPWGLHEFTAADADGNLLRIFHDFATPEGERRAGR